MHLSRLLTDEDRELLVDVILDMWEVCRDTMKRKIARANVQQAFVLDTVLNLFRSTNSSLYDPKVLSVGCFDDTAYEYLRKKSVDIVGIDPVLNFDIHSFRNGKIPEELGYDIIFSTSVIEHVEDDEEFLDDICKLLKPNGYGILTMDFNNDYSNNLISRVISIILQQGSRK